MFLSNTACVDSSAWYLNCQHTQDLFCLGLILWCSCMFWWQHCTVNNTSFSGNQIRRHTVWVHSELERLDGWSFSKFIAEFGSVVVSFRLFYWCSIMYRFNFTCLVNIFTQIWSLYPNDHSFDHDPGPEIITRYVYSVINIIWLFILTYIIYLWWLVVVIVCHCGVTVHRCMFYQETCLKQISHRCWLTHGKVLRALGLFCSSVESFQCYKAAAAQPDRLPGQRGQGGSLSSAFYSVSRLTILFQGGAFHWALPLLSRSYLSPCLCFAHWTPGPLPASDFNEETLISTRLQQLLSTLGYGAHLNTTHELCADIETFSN